MTRVTTMRARAWVLYDQIVATAPARTVSPWRKTGSTVEFRPDYQTLQKLLGVPVFLSAATQTGVPALALDVWISYELRRAGFDPDAVWPRATAPRVLPGEILTYINSLPKKVGDPLRARINQGGGGAMSANLLGKNYVKQVDVVMSSWATGPELLISTKRMDSSFGKNAANRVEESYGDAKNLRSRHPQAALGFVYGLGAAALNSEPDTAAWLIDLLGKLGREEDAYDAVALVIPEKSVPDGDDLADPAGPLTPGATDSDDIEEAAATMVADIEMVPLVSLRHAEVPEELSPSRFLKTMTELVLYRTPINFHRQGRSLHP